MRRLSMAQRAFSVAFVLLQLSVLDASGSSGPQGGSVTLPAAGVTETCSGATGKEEGCLQVLGKNEEPLRFDQYTKRENIMNKLVRERGAHRRRLVCRMAAWWLTQAVKFRAELAFTNVSVV